MDQVPGAETRRTSQEPAGSKVRKQSEGKHCNVLLTPEDNLAGNWYGEGANIWSRTGEAEDPGEVRVIGR